MALYEDTIAEFEKYMGANWIATPVFYDNAKVEQQDRTPWVRFIVNPLLGVNMALGDRSQIDGIVVAQIMLPLQVGTRRGYQLADEFNALFENKTFLNGRIFTYAGDTTRVGDDGHGWFIFSAKVPFQST